MSERMRSRPSAQLLATIRQGNAGISIDELATATGISVTRVTRLVRLGIVEPIEPGANRFAAATAAQLKRMVRLHADLGVNLTGAAIIVDLLERLERLEADLARVEGGGH
jgi:chaperone modulatory protein CbpM